MLVEELDLPDEVIDFLVEHDKIEKLYPPQAEAVKKGLFDGKNMLVCIPTAAGKTFIGELAILKCVIERKKKAIYLAPLRALAAEKYHDFKRFEKLGLKVTITSGDYDSKDAWLNLYDVIVSTNEKMDALMRHGIEWLDQVGLLVVDEAHLIGEKDRGPILEVLLTKFRKQNPETQLLCLSATIRNTELFAQWLDAELVESEWRPVKLREAVSYGHVILYDDETRKRIPKAYNVPLLDLVIDSLHDGGQVLIFCNTRKRSLTTAQKIAEMVDKRFVSKDDKKKSHLEGVVKEIKAHFGAVTVEVEELCQLIVRGVAYHNAGLSSFLRHVIEREFRAGNILVLTATPTLSAGINLPARRVIITSVWRYQEGDMKPISVMEYKQMAGRAGRPRYDPHGTAIIMASNAKAADDYFSRYVHGEVEELISKLNSEPALRRTVLSLISNQLVIDYDALRRFMELTFWGYATTKDELYPETLERKLGKVLDFFEKNHFIGFDVVEQVFIPNDLGKRVSTLYLDPLSASMIIKGLQKAVDPELTPSALSYLMLVSITPDMIPLNARKREFKRLEKLTKKHGEAFLLLDHLPSKHSVFREQFLGFFKTTLVLYRWIEEHPPPQIIDDAGIGMGDLNRIVETATWLIHCTKELAQIFLKEQEDDSWHEVIEDLKVLELRVQFGVKSDLLNLIKIKGIGRIRARILYQNGIKDVKTLATTDVHRIASFPGFGLKLAQSIQEEARQLTDLDLDAADLVDLYFDSEPESLVDAEAMVEPLVLDDMIIESQLKKSDEVDTNGEFRLIEGSSSKKSRRTRISSRVSGDRSQKGSTKVKQSLPKESRNENFISAAELLKKEAAVDEGDLESSDMTSDKKRKQIKNSKRKSKSGKHKEQQSLDDYL